MKIISRMVDYYGEIRYNEKTFFVGEEFSRQRVYLAVCPSCSSHSGCEAEDYFSAINGKSNNFSILKTGQIIGTPYLPLFCLQVLDRLAMSLKETEREVRFNEPVNNRSRNKAVIFLKDDNIALPVNAVESIPEVHPRAVIQNIFFDQLSENFKFIFHKTRVFLSRFLKTKRSSL